MHALIFERNATTREALIEVLSWFGHISHVSVVDSEHALDRLQHKMAFDLIIVGDVGNQLHVVRRLRRNTPVQLVAYRQHDGTAFARLSAAGADLVFDAELSPLRIGQLLRSLFQDVCAWHATGPTRSPARSMTQPVSHRTGTTP